MRILIRQYVKNGDKSNKTVDSIDEALRLLGKSFKDIYLKVDWRNQVDLFFVGTDDYLRITN